MTAPVVVTVTRKQRDAVLDFMRDGASVETVSRRLGISLRHAYNHLSDVRTQADAPNYTALALGLERGQIKLRIINRGADR